MKKYFKGVYERILRILSWMSKYLLKVLERFGEILDYFVVVCYGLFLLSGEAVIFGIFTYSWILLLFLAAGDIILRIIFWTPAYILSGINILSKNSFKEMEFFFKNYIPKNVLEWSLYILVDPFFAVYSFIKKGIEFIFINIIKNYDKKRSI